MQNIIIIGSRGHDYKNLKYIEKNNFNFKDIVLKTKINNTIIIAEAGINHNGSIKIAKN